ncbi:Hypothetical predicted protein, partial [Paramuricea clavata]
LCEIVADTKAAIEPELYVSSHRDCNPCGNDIKNVKLHIEDLQKQISSINNVIDSTNGIIESISEILLPGDGGGLTRDHRTDATVNELFKIIDEKNKVIMDRDNTIREFRTKLLEAESERDSLKQQKYSALDTQDTSQCNDTIENQQSLSSKTIPIDENTGTRHENNTDIRLNNGKSYVSDSNSALQNIPVPAIITLKTLTSMSLALSKNNPENWLGRLPLLEGKHKASCTLKFAKQNISQTFTMKTTDARMTANAINTPKQPMSKNTKHKCFPVDWMERLPLIEGKPKLQPVQRPNNISCPESYKNDNYFLKLNWKKRTRLTGSRCHKQDWINHLKLVHRTMKR